MKIAVVVCLAIIAAGVTYLAMSEYRENAAIDDAQARVYQSRIANGIQEAAEARIFVERHYEETGEFPVGPRGAPGERLSHIRALLIMDDGEVQLHFSGDSLGLPQHIARPSLYFKPTVNEFGGLDWDCTADPQFAVERDLVPATCR